MYCIQYIYIYIQYSKLHFFRLLPASNETTLIFQLLQAMKAAGILSTPLNAAVEWKRRCSRSEN